MGPDLIGVVPLSEISESSHSPRSAGVFTLRRSRGETVRKWLSASQKESSHRNYLDQNLNIGLLAFRAVRNTFLLFNLPSLCLVMAA